MEHEQSTSAATADPHATSIEQRTAEHIRTAVLASEQRITEQFFTANAALLAQLQQSTGQPVTTDQQQSIPADATPATEGGKVAPQPPVDMLDDEPEPTASEFVDFTYYGEVIPAGLERPPRDVDEPRLWTLTEDTARALADKRTQAAYGEYLHMGCYAFFDSCANAVISEGVDKLSNSPPLSAEQTAVDALIRAGHRTHTATEEAARTRLGFLRLTKGGHASTNCSQNWLTSVFVARALPRSPAHWMRFAKLSSTERLRSAFTLPAKLLQVQPSPRSRRTSHHAMTSRPARPPPTDARRQQQRRQTPAQHLLPNQATRHGHRPRNDGVTIEP
jgi:hypothetical protein